MKKVILSAGIVQLILAAVLVGISVMFQQTARDAENVEKQLAENCFALHSALINSEATFNASGNIVDELIVQLNRLSKNLKLPGMMRAVMPPKLDRQLEDMGKTCSKTAGVLTDYRKRTSPEIVFALQETSKSLEMTGRLIRDRKPGTGISMYVLLLGMTFAVICFFNGIFLLVLAFKKNNQLDRG